MKFSLFSLFDYYFGSQNEAAYYADALDMVVEGERLGYDTVWFGEEHFYSFGICPSPQILLTSVAARTERIKLGTAISLTAFDHPLRKAEDFAMLDVLSGGRLKYGCGRGSIRNHFKGFDVDANESKSRYDESLAIVKAAWTEERVNFEGEHWTVTDVAVSPKPLQQPRPPIYQGTVSIESYEKAAIAGDNAFAVPWTIAPHDEIKTRIDRYRELCNEHGHGHKEVAGVFFLFCDDDQRRAVATARQVSQNYAELLTKFAKHKSLMHNPGSTLFSQTDFLLSIGENIEERGIVGTPEQCIRRIQEVSEELGGIDEFAFYFLAGDFDVAAARRNVELFGNEVIPYFAERSQPATVAAS